MGLYQKDGRWWMSFTPPGKPRVRVSTGILVGESRTERKDNEAAARRLMDAAQKGVLVAKLTEEVGTGRAVPTFATFAEYYREHYISRHRGASRELEILDGYLIPRLGSLALDRITVDTLREYESRRLNEKVRANTINRETDFLKAIMKAAAKHKHIERSPLAGEPKLRITKRPKVRMSVQDEERILATVEEPADRAMLIMGIDTLARMSDILDFRREHDHGRTITIVDPKNGELLEVPCSRRLRAALDAIPAHPSGYYFAHRRVAEKPRDWVGSVRQMFRRACKRAGVRYGREVAGLTWHRATRATGASRMLDARIPMPAVQAIGGWKDLKSVQAYVTPSDRILMEAVEVVSEGVSPTPGDGAKVLRHPGRRAG